jgi:hypothetical protein
VPKAALYSAASAGLQVVGPGRGHRATRPRTLGPSRFENLGQGRALGPLEPIVFPDSQSVGGDLP